MRKILQRVALAFGLAILWPTLVYATGQVVTGTVTFNANFTETATGGIINNPLSQYINQPQTYTNGTGSNQVDTIYAAKISLVASTPQTLDLSTLTDPAGNAINFARVREFIVQNTSSTAGFDVLVLQGASNGCVFLPASGGIPARYGAVLRLSDPLSTGSSNGNYVDGTHKTAKLDPGSNACTVSVLIVGGSAQ